MSPSSCPTRCAVFFLERPGGWDSQCRAGRTATSFTATRYLCGRVPSSAGFSLVPGRCRFTHVRVDGEGLRAIRRKLGGGAQPFAIAPEGQCSYRSETLPRLEKGVPQLGFWCAEDLEAAGRSESVFVLPVSMHASIRESDIGRLEAMAEGLERKLALEAGNVPRRSRGVEPNGEDRRRGARPKAPEDRPRPAVHGGAILRPRGQGPRQRRRWGGRARRARGEKERPSRGGAQARGGRSRPRLRGRRDRPCLSDPIRGLAPLIHGDGYKVPFSPRSRARGSEGRGGLVRDAPHGARGPWLLPGRGLPRVGSREWRRPILGKTRGDGLQSRRPRLSPCRRQFLEPPGSIKETGDARHRARPRAALPPERIPRRPARRPRAGPGRSRLGL